MNKGVLCLFYSQFDIEKGGEIIVQYPNGYLSNEEFIKISEYVVPKPELCNKSISVKLGSSYLMGYPIYLTSKNYNRTRFQFNFSLIIKEDSFEVSGIVFDLLLMKIAKTFEEFEINSSYNCILHNRENISGFVKELHLALQSNPTVIRIPISLSQSLDSFRDSKNLEIIKDEALLPPTMMDDSNISLSPEPKYRCDTSENDANNSKIMRNQNIRLLKTQTNNRLICDLGLNRTNLINAEFTFKFLDLCNSNIEVGDHMVPVLINYISNEDYKYYDMKIKTLIQYIDGISFIKKIASCCEMDLKYVKFIIYNLYLNKIVTLVDIFQFSNIYQCTPKIFEYYQTDELYVEFEGFYYLNKYACFKSSNPILPIKCFRPSTETKNNSYFQQDQDGESDNKTGKEPKFVGRNFAYALKSFTFGINSHQATISEQLSLFDKSLDSESLFTLYCELGKCGDVKEFLDSFYVYGIDLHLFVAFGIYKRIIEEFTYTES